MRAGHHRVLALCSAAALSPRRLHIDCCPAASSMRGVLTACCSTHPPQHSLLLGLLALVLPCTGVLSLGACVCPRLCHMHWGGLLPCFTRLLELTGAKEPAALEKLVKAVGVKPAAVNKDLLMYKGVLSKLSAAKVSQHKADRVVYAGRGWCAGRRAGPQRCGQPGSETLSAVFSIECGRGVSVIFR